MHDEKEILLTRMFAGRYCKKRKNIGYESINLFRNDNDENYIFVTSYGTVGSGHGNIEDILLVTWESIGTMKIMAKAVGITPLMDFSTQTKKENKTEKSERLYREYFNYIKDKNIKYGGVSLDCIYVDNISMEGKKEENAIRLTYKVEQVLYPKQSLYIQTAQKETKKENSIFIGDVNFPKSSLQWTYAEYSRAYNELKKAIENPKLWENENKTPKIPVEFDKESFFNDFLKPMQNKVSEKCAGNFKKNYERFLESISEKNKCSKT